MQHTRKLSVWLVLPFFMTHVYIVRSAASADENPELSVRVTHDHLVLKGTAVLLRGSAVSTIQILLNSCVNSTSRFVHKGVNQRLNNESEKNVTTGDTRPALDSYSQPQVSVDTGTEVLATLDTSGVRPSSYLNLTHPDFHIAGSVQARPSPWLQVILFNLGKSNFGSYYVKILYTSNPADISWSVWKSNELTFTSETTLPMEVPGFTMTTGKGTEVDCSYRQHEEIILQMSVLSGVQVLSWWRQEKEPFCHEGCVCHTRNVNTSHFSLLVHCCLEYPVSVFMVNTSDLKCAVTLEKNGVRLLKSSVDEQKTDQHEHTHQAQTDGLTAAEMAGVAVGTVVSFIFICFICALAMWRVRCHCKGTQSLTNGQGWRENINTQGFGKKRTPSFPQRNTHENSFWPAVKTDTEAVKSDSETWQPFVHKARPSGTKEAAGVLLPHNKAVDYSDDSHVDVTDEETPGSILSSIAICSNSNSDLTASRTTVEFKTSIPVADTSSGDFELSERS